MLLVIPMETTSLCISTLLDSQYTIGHIFHSLRFDLIMPIVYAFVVSSEENEMLQVLTTLIKLQSTVEGLRT